MAVDGNAPSARPERAAVGRGSNDEGDKGGLSGAMTASLLAHRTVALQAHVAQRPSLALRLLAQALILNHTNAAYRAPLGLRLSQPATLSYQLEQETKDGPARRLLNEAHERRGDHQPGETHALLPWLLAMEDAQVLDLLAPLVAGGIDAGSTDWTRDGNGLQAQAAAAAGFDAGPYWTPDTETYFGRVTKAQIAGAVRESGASGSFSPDGKKADVAAAATRLVADTGWLPALLRPPVPVLAEEDAQRHDEAA